MVEQPGKESLPSKLEFSEEAKRRLQYLQEAHKEKRFKVPYTDEQVSEIDRAATDKELLAGSAKLAFDEAGKVNLKPTVGQLDKIQGEWEQFVQDTAERYVNASDEFIERKITELAQPDRNRGGELQNIYKMDKTGTLEKEQRERAVLKEILERRRAEHAGD